MRGSSSHPGKSGEQHYDDGGLNHVHCQHERHGGRRSDRGVGNPSCACTQRATEGDGEEDAREYVEIRIGRRVNLPSRANAREAARGGTTEPAMMGTGASSG